MSLISKSARALVEPQPFTGHLAVDFYRHRLVNKRSTRVPKEASQICDTDRSKP